MKFVGVVFALQHLTAGVASFAFPTLQTTWTLTRKSTQLTSVTSGGSTLVDAPADDVFIEEKPEDDSDQFDWFKAWYPIVPVEILDHEKPHRFQLLGMDIVVWNDGPVGSGLFGSKKKRPQGAITRTGTWRSFVDECPHRKVPLSEGRVEDDGTLLCSYHAWRFDGEGSCVAVPQVSDESELTKIKANPKTSCNSFPTKIVNGVLFVWPSSDENSRLEAELTPVVHRAAEENKERVWEGPWNYRELPYGADFFLENVVDPAHVTVSHHNVVGDRYMDQTMSMETVQSLTKDGFSVEVRNTMGGLPSTTNFYAPSLVAIDAPINKEGARQTLELYCSPSRPGFCNHVGRMVILKDDSGKMPSLLRQFTLPMPKWLNHVLASAFLNQDALFLHHQERSMARTGSYKAFMDQEEEPYHYTKSVYPVAADKGVINFRNWIRLLAGGGIPYRHNPSMPDASNDVVFDVWNAHTKHCKYCQDALRRIKKIRLAAFFLSVVTGVVRPFGAIGSLSSTIGLAGVGMALHKLVGMFYRFEFSHARND